MALGKRPAWRYLETRSFEVVTNALQTERVSSLFMAVFKTIVEFPLNSHSYMLFSIWLQEKRI
jgi:hypothetical protein